MSLDWTGCDLVVSGTARNVTVALIGEFDLASAPALTEQLNAIMVERPDAVCVDLTRLDFIDSSGINVLLRASLTANATGVAFRCANPQPQAHRTMAILNLLDVLGVEVAPATD